MWTMDCGDVNEVKLISPLISYASNIAKNTITTLGPNNSNDSDCTSARIIKPSSIFKHLVPENKSARTLAVQSTRWSPTPEQLMALEELYKHGTRTPTALQIQEITAKLRRFGKIEGKNVFYWFQNHKARDKKKQRLKLEAQRRHLDQQCYSKTKDHSVIPKVTSLEVEQTKREPLSNCSTISEESGSVPRATTHSRLVQVEEQKDELNKVIKAKEEMHVSSFKPMELPFCFPVLNLNGTRPNTLISLALEHKLLERPHDYTESLMPDRSGLSVFSNIFGDNYGIRESTIQTLELFPLQSENLKGFNRPSGTTSDHHEEGTKNVPFFGDLSLDLLLASLEN